LVFKYLTDISAALLVFSRADDDYIAKIAHFEQEVCQLIEAGFEYVCDYNGNRIFRKRK